MLVTINDIDKRIRNKGNIKSIKNLSESMIYTNHGDFCTANALDAIKYWEGLSEDSNEAFGNALDVFVEVCLNCNENTIKEVSRYLYEGIDKVRDAGGIANLIKHRTARFKTKLSTKIAKKNEKINNANNQVIGNIAQKVSQLGKGTGGVAKAKIASPIQQKQEPDQEKQQQAAQEAFDTLLNKAKLVKEVDRIIENYSKVSKRFNIDNIVSEVKRDNEMYQCINDITRCVDTFRLPFKHRYNAALETAYYAMAKHYMQYPTEKIIEAVTDYFIFSNGLSESDRMDIKRISNISVLFEQSDFDIIKFLYDKETPVEEKSNVVELSLNLGYNSLAKDFMTISEGELKDMASAAKDTVKEWTKGNPEERKDKEVQKMIDDFRDQCAKNDKSSTNITLLKSLINKIFTKTPGQIVYQLPNIFGIIRASFILAGMYIHPVVGIIAFITNWIIKTELNRKQCEKIIKAYDDEIKAVDNKLEKAKDDKSKENLEAYKKELEEDIKKIKEYERTLYSEEENDERDMQSYEFDDDFDFDFDDDEWDTDFDEAALVNAASIIVLGEMTQAVSELLVDDNLDGIVCDNIFKFSNDDLDLLADFSNTVPVILERKKLCEALENYRDELRQTDRTLDTYIRIDCLNDNIHKLKESTLPYNTSIKTKDIMHCLQCMKEMAAVQGDGFVNEMSFTNSLQVAMKNLKAGLTKLTDKEKQVSKSIDISVNNVSRGLEDAVKNDSREAVIKGRILPSASKTIKLALATGAAWAINPAVAVVGAIGAFAMSGKLRKEERQLVLDDIEIELRMCERHMKKAEDDGDMEKVRQMEILNRNLIRQKQRLQYKMKTVWRQPIRTAEPPKGAE